MLTKDIFSDDGWRLDQKMKLIRIVFDGLKNTQYKKMKNDLCTEHFKTIFENNYFKRKEIIDRATQDEDERDILLTFYEHAEANFMSWGSANYVFGLGTHSLSIATEEISSLFDCPLPFEVKKHIARLTGKALQPLNCSETTDKKELISAEHTQQSAKYFIERYTRLFERSLDCLLKSQKNLPKQKGP